MLLSLHGFDCNHHRVSAQLFLIEAFRAYAEDVFLVSCIDTCFAMEPARALRLKGFAVTFGSAAQYTSNIGTLTFRDASLPLRSCCSNVRLCVLACNRPQACFTATGPGTSRTSSSTRAHFADALQRYTR